MSKSPKIAVVAVESNLVGRIVTRVTNALTPAQRTERRMSEYEGVAHLWPTDFQPSLDGRYTAEIVAVFVGYLQDGGSLQVALKDSATGRIAVVGTYAFTV